MKRKVFLIILPIIALVIGCSNNTSVVDFVRKGGLESSGTVNLALAANGGEIIVSKDNPDHPAATLNNGITSSDGWNKGEGWETKYQGRFARGRYLAYGVEDPMLAGERGLNENFDSGDPSWRGLKLQTSRGAINTALGWVIIQFPEEKKVNRVVVYTVDTPEFPADKFGVSDLLLQYWSESVGSWMVVERFGKSVGQTGNAIHNNKSPVINFRFKPVKTSKLRLVIRWTNDSNRYTRGYYTYATGTIRLVEIEVYGYEKQKGEPANSAPSSAIQDVNKIAEVKIVIENYVDGYNRKDIDMLFSSISPNYRKGTETYSGLRERISSIFQKYEHIHLQLRNLGVKLTGTGAIAKSDYEADYEAPGTDAITVSGTLTFYLSSESGNWKIIRIDVK